MFEDLWRYMSTKQTVSCSKKAPVGAFLSNFFGLPSEVGKRFV